MKRSVVILLSILLAIAFNGCGKNAEEAAGDSVGKDSNEPVKLKVYFFQPGFLDTDFQAKFLPYLEKKFPHISYELMNPTKGVTFQDFVAASDIPDIIFAGEKEVPQLSVLGVPEDLNAMIKEYKVDMNQFEPIATKTIKNYSDKGETLALVYALQYYATFYNKDIFDKFGVSYPKDGMSWDDLIELGKKLTRNEGGVQYMDFRQAAQQPSLKSSNWNWLTRRRRKRCWIRTAGGKCSLLVNKFMAYPETCRL